MARIDTDWKLKILGQLLQDLLLWLQTENNQKKYGSLYDVKQISPGSTNHNTFESLHVSGKLPTYAFPKPTFCSTWEVSVSVGLGEG